MKTKKVATPKGTLGFSLLDAFLKTIKLDKDETAIDITQNPEKLVGFTGWKKIKLVNNPEKEAYFYFKKGIPSESSETFTKEFAKNLSKLVDKKKFKKNLADFLCLDLEDLDSDESSEMISEALTSNENINEISFAKDGRIAFYSNKYESYDCKESHSDGNGATSEFIEKLFEKEKVKKIEKETKGKIVEINSYDELSVKSNFTGVLKVPTGKSWNYSDYKELHYKNGEYHRLNGPSMEYHNGTKSWYKNGLKHREDGPAFEHTDGRKDWWVEGKRHRTDGPAIEYANGTKEWYIEGKFFSQEKEFKAAVKKYLELEKQLKETKAKLNSKPNPPENAKSVSEKNTNTEPKKVVKENSTKELAVIANFPSLKEVEPNFSGKATVGGVPCYFTNGLLHNEIGPAVESELVERNYAINGIVMTKAEFRNYKAFQLNYKNITPEFLISYYKATKTVEKYKFADLPEFEVDIYSAGSKDWCFSPQLINGKFSDKKILTSIEIYDKNNLPHSRLEPAIVDRFKGELYFINGEMYPSINEWAETINLELKELKKIYREAISFENLMKSLENIEKITPKDFAEGKSVTGWFLQTTVNGSEKSDQIIFLKNGTQLAEFKFVGNILEGIWRLQAENGPTIMSNISGIYQTELIPTYCVDGQYMDIDVYEQKYGYTHPSKILEYLLAEIDTSPKKETVSENLEEKESLIKKSISATLLNTAKSDSREVAKRIAAKKISVFTQNILTSIIESAASKNKNIEKIKEFLQSSNGHILIKFLSGVSINLLKDRFDPKYKDLLVEISTEFRIQSETDLSLEVIELAEGLIKDTELFSKLSGFEEKIRIQVDEFKTLPLQNYESEIETAGIAIPKYVN